MKKQPVASFRPEPDVYQMLRGMGLVDGRGRRKTNGVLTVSKVINQAVRHYLHHLAKQPDSPITTEDLELASIRGKAIRLAEEEHRLKREKDRLTEEIEDLQRRKEQREKATYIANNGV